MGKGTGELIQLQDTGKEQRDEEWSEASHLDLDLFFSSISSRLDKSSRRVGSKW